MGRFIVTRAEPGASATAGRLRAMGHDALLAPMLRIDSVPADMSLDGVSVIAFTSANGVRAFAERAARRDLPVYCVGDATAAAAHAAGFSQVASAGGDVAALAAHIATHRAPAQGKILHVAGADLAGDLAGALQARGFTVETRVHYKAVESDVLDPAPLAALKVPPPWIDGVLFHSARAAAAFARAASMTLSAQESFTRITAFCMSDAVADSARALVWRQVCVAAEPQEAALLALLPRQPQD